MGNQELPADINEGEVITRGEILASLHQAFAGAQLIAKSLSILSQEGTVFGERFVEEFQTPKFLFSACLWIYQVKVVLPFSS